MELRTTEEARANVTEFTSRLVNLMLDKKKIDADIKALKQEFKEEGVPCGVVSAVVNRIKALKKKSNDEIFEENTIQEWLETNNSIDDKIGQLAET